jgi:hypothetical protein
MIGRFQTDELNKLIREVEKMQIMVSMSCEDADVIELMQVIAKKSLDI